MRITITLDHEDEKELAKAQAKHPMVSRAALVRHYLKRGFFANIPARLINAEPPAAPVFELGSQGREAKIKLSDLSEKDQALLLNQAAHNATLGSEFKEWENFSIAGPATIEVAANPFAASKGK